MLLEPYLKVNDIKPDQGHLDIDKIEHFIDLRNTPVYFFFTKIYNQTKKTGRHPRYRPKKRHIKDNLCPYLRKMSDRAEHVLQ